MTLIRAGSSRADSRWLCVFVMATNGGIGGGGQHAVMPRAVRACLCASCARFPCRPCFVNARDHERVQAYADVAHAQSAHSLSIAESCRVYVMHAKRCMRRDCNAAARLGQGCVGVIIAAQHAPPGSKSLGMSDARTADGEPGGPDVLVMSILEVMHAVCFTSATSCVPDALSWSCLSLSQS